MSFSDFLVGAIVSELSNHFTLRYDDHLFKSRVYYTNARTLLKKNNFVFKEKGTGFSLYRKEPELYRLELDMGVFSAPFINELILMEVSGVNMFPLGFNTAYPKQYQGKLAAFSPRYLASLDDGFPLVQADEGAMSMFLSDQVVNTGTNNIFRVTSDDLIPIPRNEFESNGVIDFNFDSDDDGIDLERRPLPKFNKIKPVQPFYHVITMERRCRLVKVLPKIWKQKLESDGLSWEFDAEKSRLYVANTLGASYGFPPAPHHIHGFPLLGLDVQSKEGNSQVELQEGAGAYSLAAVDPCSIVDNVWEGVLQCFLDEPCMSTFVAFRESVSVSDAYEVHKGAPGYKMGTNKSPLAQIVRTGMRGPENAIAWPNFVVLLHDIARPNDLKGILILLFKLRLFIVEAQDGRIYASS